MRRLSEPKKEIALVDVDTNASRDDFEIKEELKKTIEFKKELRILSDSLKKEKLPFEDTAISLKIKLNSIWDKSIEFIQLLENKYKTNLLESLIQIDISYINAKDPRSKEFSLATGISKIYKLNDIRARHYFLTLKCIYKINHIYENFYEQKGLVSNPFTDEFKERLFKDENFKSGKFINLVVQEFFSLSTNAYELGKVCGIRVGAPLSKELSFYRSENAWKKKIVSKNLKIIRSSQGLNPEAMEALEELENIFDPYGEEVLVDRIRKIIPKLSPKSNCKSVLAVINDNEKLFKNLLDEYIAGIGSPIVKNGRHLTYKPNLDKPGLAILIKKRNLFTEIKAQIKSLSKADRPNKSS